MTIKELAENVAKHNTGNGTNRTIKIKIGKKLYNAIASAISFGYIVLEADKKKAV